jgi:hypothetical protein
MPVLPNAVLPGNTLNGSVGAQIGTAIRSSILGSVGLSEASNRQNVAQMFQYSSRTAGPNPAIIYPNANTDWRVRISLAPGANYFYKDPNNTLLSPLVTEIGGSSSSGIGSSILGALGALGGGTQRVGVVFPYTPQVQITHSANYSQQKLTHNNYTQYFYDNSEVQAITLSGTFTVQNINEGQYLLAAIYFFRSITKMFFGMDPNAGNPPPLVYLNGYGEYYLPNVPCVVTQFQHTMPADVDYIDIPEPSITKTAYNPQLINYRLNSTRLPTTSTVMVSLQPVYSRLSQSQGFSLNDFARGALINAQGANGTVTAFGQTQGSTYTAGANRGGFL